MNKLNFAASRLVNPPGVSPEITETQLWAGLQRKVRFPQEFVPAITSCEIISDTEHKVSRSVVFRGGVSAREEIELYEGTIAYFDMPATGIRITNVVSYDEEDRLVLTFSFAEGIPGYDASSTADGGKPSAKELNKKVGQGVEHTIKNIREMVAEGKLA